MSEERTPLVSDRREAEAAPLLGEHRSGNHSDTLSRSTSKNSGMHPAWRTFLRFCEEFRHGEIERLKIQDGLPVLAEVTRKKVKFAP